MLLPTPLRLVALIVLSHGSDIDSQQTGVMVVPTTALGDSLASDHLDPGTSE